MSYLSRDQSQQLGDVVMLFLFVQGVTEWRYTSAAQTIQHDGYDWIPTQIKMGQVTQSNEMNKDVLTMDFPYGHVFASQFIEYSPEQVTSVTVIRMHLDEPEVGLYWKGRVVGASADTTITVTCEPIFTSLKRAGLRARYQILCRHALYQRGCNLNKDDFAITGTATAVDGNLLTVTEAAGLSAGDIVGGMISYNGVLRYVMNHVIDQLTLIRPIPELTQAITDNGATSIIMYPGCKHNYTVCLNKFNNLDNLGAFPWIPESNPFEFRSLI